MLDRKWLAWGTALVVAIVLVSLPFGLRNYGIYILSLWTVMCIGSMGLNLTLGYAGQISLAQAAFVGIGAYITALLTTKAGVPFLATIPISAVACFAIGWILGYPALRVQHHYLAFVTLAFTTLAYLVFRNEEWLTGGIFGVRNIPRPELFGYATTKALPYYMVCLAVLGVVSGATWWLVNSAWGRAFIALRENPVRAQSLGIDTRRYTMMAFAIGSSLGGVAGSLYAPLLQYIDPSGFTVVLSINLLLMVVVGGSGYFAGPFVGAIVAVLLPEWLRVADEYYLIFYAILVMSLMAFFPSGILGMLQHLVASFRKAAP